MKINIIKKSNLNIKEDTINITIEANNNNNVNDLIRYIKKYNNKNIIVNEDYQSIIINYNDIIYFYSEKKNNYCRTISNKNYKVKSKLYELEKIDNFIRISKNYIVNVDYIKYFDFKETGKIVVKMYDETELKVARRRIGKVLDFLEEKKI